MFINPSRFEFSEVTRAIKTWSGDARWVYSTVTPFVAGDVSASKYLHVTSGVGWTPGYYAILQRIAAFNVGSDGNQDIVHLDSAPASAGASGGLASIDDGSRASYLYVAEGDSITAGQGAVPYSAYVKKLKGSAWKIYNSGVGGATLSDMISQYTAEIHPQFDATKLINFLSIFGGTNDLYSLASSAATVLARINTFGQTGVNDSFVVFVVTMLPRSGGSTPGDFETNRTTINTALRADFNVSTGYARVFKAASGITYGHYLVDIAANTTIGDAGDETNTTYYQDGVHPTAAGQSLIGTDVANAITQAFTDRL